MLFTNFDIRIEAVRDGVFTVKAESETQGETSSEVTAQWVETNLYEGLIRIDARKTDAAFLAEFGAQLLKTLFPDKVFALYQRAIGEARAQGNGGVRIRLLIDDATLEEIPWELGYSTLDEQFLAAQTTTPFVRYLSVPCYKRSLLTSSPMRILLASPRGSGLENAAAEELSIRDALAGMGEKVELIFAHREADDGLVTSNLIERLLNKHEIHVFHFIGHGNHSNNSGSLSFDDGQITESRLGAIFSNNPSLALVVLNACEGGMGSTDLLLTGTAAALVKKGIPAVIAMRYEIYDDAALLFAKRLYQSLFDSKEAGRVDYALAFARQGLAEAFSDERELATPVLFTHTDSSILFIKENTNPLQGSAIQTLLDAKAQQASASTPDNPELATIIENEGQLINRKLIIGTLAFRGALTAACLALFLSWISFLDVFGLETWAEFVTGSLGDQWAEHSLDSSLEIIALPNDSIREKRAALNKLLSDIAQSAPGVIAIDSYFSVDQGTGEFSTEVAAGHQLANTMRSLVDQGIDIIISPDLKNNMIPAAMKDAGVRSGHNCTQGSVGIFRALPLFIKHETLETDHAFSAMAVRAFQGDNVRFDASEFDQRKPFRSLCSLLDGKLDGNNSEIGTRFLRFSPLELLENRITDIALFSSDAAQLDDHFKNKLVLIGFRDEKDIVNTLSDHRDGFLWQADAINNLLSQTLIARVSTATQFLLMALIGGVAGYIRLSRSPSRLLSVILLLALSVAIWILCAGVYAVLDWVANPSYLILSMLIGWLLCGIFKKRFPQI